MLTVASQRSPGKRSAPGFTYGNGLVHTLTQNARGLPERSRDAYGTTAVLDDSYDYDQNANALAITDGATGRNQRGNRTMAYDGLDRLTKVVSPMFANATDSEARYGYDVLDNLLTVHIKDRHHFYCYDNNSNHLTNIKTSYCDSGQTVIGLGYDEQGNLENRNGQLFEFDYGNRLRSAVGKETYRYDGHGRRVLATSETGQGAIRSLYGHDGVLRYQWDDRQQKVFNHIYLAGSLIATRETPYNSSVNTIRYQHTDALGSPVAVTDSNRTVIERFEYEPFGKVINPASPKDGPGYTGHVYDAATGLNYMQQRYYDPLCGCFLSVDPVTAYEKPGQNFNRYWYANNNPYKFTDPDGRIVKTLNSADEQTVAATINAESETRYRFNNGQLESTGTCNAIANSSPSYSSAIDNAINSSATLNIDINQTVKINGQLQDVDLDHGGGLTAQHASGDVTVVISGNPSLPDTDVDGNVVIDAPSSVLRHEITGHADPMLRNINGNARDFDNVSRSELGKTKLSPNPPNGIPDPAR